MHPKGSFWVSTITGLDIMGPTPSDALNMRFTLNKTFWHSFKHQTVLSLVALTLLLALLGHSAQSFGADEPISENSNAFNLKTLLMPGKVIEGHAKYEKQCDLCHGDDRPALCRDCHEAIDQDIKEDTGIHGHRAEGNILNCIECHTDHIGRDADILNFDQDNFNHSHTDFNLTGQHSQLQCSSCHEAGKNNYRDAPHACFDCHEKDDHHKGAFGEECSDCHTTDGWAKKNTFDHSETEFELLGKHNEVQCSACHPDQKYEKTPKTCVACHAVNDVHNSTNGKECDKCHKEEAWDELVFDHDVDTDFKLHGEHKPLNCNACHTKPGYEDKPSMRCVDCHENDDKHLGRNGRQCDDCHNPNSWKKQTFDHDIDTKFALDGQHTELTCESCHKTADTTDKIGSQCIDCHKQDDVHKGQQGKECTQCHNTSGWEEKVRFDHNLATFPLTGMHAVTSCDACHTTPEYRDAKSECYACHKEDDKHNKTQGTDCGACHNPNDWKLWIFDHSKQTNFELEGAHTNLSCGSCHTTPTEGTVKQSASCIACHAKDDEHNKRFGRTCERCHTTESFKDIRMQ